MFAWLKHLLRRSRVPAGLVFTNEEAERARQWAGSHTVPISGRNPRIYTGADGKPKILPRPSRAGAICRPWMGDAP